MSSISVRGGLGGRGEVVRLHKRVVCTAVQVKGRGFRNGYRGLTHSRCTRLPAQVATPTKPAKGTLILLPRMPVFRIAGCGSCDVWEEVKCPGVNRCSLKAVKRVCESGIGR